MKYNNDEKRNIIMQHYLNPNNLDSSLKFQNDFTKYGETCGDVLTIEFKIENEILKKIVFNGKGCSIFMSSTDIFIDLIKNKNLGEIQKYMKWYENLIDGNDLNIEELEKLKELNIFDNIKQFDNRKRCAKMIIEFLKYKLYETK